MVYNNLLHCEGFNNNNYQELRVVNKLLTIYNYDNNYWVNLMTADRVHNNIQ